MSDLMRFESLRAWVGYNAEYGPEDDEIQYAYREWLAEYGLDTGGSAASQKYLPCLNLLRVGRRSSRLFGV